MQVGEIDCSHLEKKLAKQLRKKKTKIAYSQHMVRERKKPTIYLLSSRFISLVQLTSVHFILLLGQRNVEKR